MADINISQRVFSLFVFSLSRYIRKNNDQAFGGDKVRTIQDDYSLIIYIYLNLSTFQFTNPPTMNVRINLLRCEKYDEIYVSGVYKLLMNQRN